MKSEEIIENLLRKRHISPKEALILLKDIAKADTKKYRYYDYNDSIITTSSPTSTGISWDDILSSTGSYTANNTSSIKTDINRYDPNP